MSSPEPEDAPVVITTEVMEAALVPLSFGTTIVHLQELVDVVLRMARQIPDGIAQWEAELAAETVASIRAALNAEAGRLEKAAAGLPRGVGS